MPQYKVYIATSLDGYIAKLDNSLDWLINFPNPNQNDYGYFEFYEGIDTVIMGRKTYEEILNFDVEWPYKNCKSYVFTTNNDYQVKTENTEVLSSITDENVEIIRNESKKNIWIVGGGNVIGHFIDKNLVEEMLLSIVPVILGDGIPLFQKGMREKYFDLKSVQSFDTGMINLVYSKKSN